MLQFGTKYTFNLCHACESTYATKITVISTIECKQHFQVQLLVSASLNPMSGKNVFAAMIFQAKAQPRQWSTTDNSFNTANL